MRLRMIIITVLLSLTMAMPAMARGRMHYRHRDRDLSFETKGLNLYVYVPVLRSQMRQEGVRPDDFVLAASLQYRRRNRWRNHSRRHRNYFRRTRYIGHNTLAGYIRLSPNAKSFKFRLWGNNPDIRRHERGKWLWISHTSAFYRESRYGEPGYEFKVRLNRDRRRIIEITPVSRRSPRRQ